jgi:hypothetical protein
MKETAPQHLQWPELPKSGLTTLVRKSVTVSAATAAREEGQRTAPRTVPAITGAVRGPAPAVPACPVIERAVLQWSASSNDKGTAAAGAGTAAAAARRAAGSYR